MTSPTPPRPTPRNDRVLLVDDDPDARTLVRLRLPDEAEIREAATVEAALVELRDWEPTRIVLDLTFPGSEDGTLILKYVRTMRPRPHVTVFTAASPSGHAWQRARSLGAAELIEKPHVERLTA